MRLTLAAIAVALASMFAGCGGGSGGGTPTALATPTATPCVSGACVGIGTVGVTIGAATPTPIPCPSVDPQLVLAFPSNAATGVSDALSSVIFIYGPLTLSGLGSWGNMSLNGVVEGQVGTPPSPLPSPLPTLGPGQSYLAASVTTTLAPKTTYELSVSFINGCGQAASESPGTFTTQ